MVVEITDSKEKQAIARKVLEALTDWFGIKESREEYISGCANWKFFAAKEDDEAVGFLCLKETGKATVELAVMGVLKDYHRIGIGRQLVEKAIETARSQGYEFIAEITGIFEKNSIPWQTGELGKIDAGGGGTIAAIMAELGMDVVDMGVPVWSMHAPVEVISKIDLYYIYLGYKVFIENIG